MIITLKTSDEDSIRPFIEKLHTPQSRSHKGQNGKVLVIGGSSLFHVAPVWSAQAASAFVDMVHLASTEENNEIIKELKKSFFSGIVVSRSQLEAYVKEDDAILIGSGMMRTDDKDSLDENINNEGRVTLDLTKNLLKAHPEKKWVIDAGALQMMNPVWLESLTQKPILTPHQAEFLRLFGVDVISEDLHKKVEIAAAAALKHKSIIFLKAVDDIVTNGTDSVVIEGGNAGLTRGGTGDVLAGITLGLYAKNDPFTSAVLASWLLKKASEDLYRELGYWYNIEDIIHQIAKVLSRLKLQ